MPVKSRRSIPKAILRQLATMEDQYLVAAVLRKFTADDLKNEKLKHLGVSLSDQRLYLPTAVIPPPGNGRFSMRNVEGHVIIRKDLPKETLYNSVETPNWGDSSYGYHTVDLPYERYPRDVIAPLYARIEIECANPDPQATKFLIRFRVSEVLDRRDDNFMDDLLFCLNLLQENVGACGLAPSKSTMADHIQTLGVDWEILPPGTAAEAIARLFQDRAPSDVEREAVEERHKFLMSLKPKRLVYGQSGFLRYFGGMITDDLVVFENVEYGNAVYIMFENWEELSKRSRVDLLSGRYGKGFERIVHSPGWEIRVEKIVEERTKI